MNRSAGEAPHAMHVTYELHRLHLADQAIKTVEDTIDGLDKGEDVRARLEEARPRLEELQFGLEQELNKIRKLERQTASAEARQKELHRRLYGGFITNPKELESCEAELGQCGERKEACETEALESMMRAEELEAEIASHQSLLEELAGELSQREQAALLARQELETQLASAREKREEQARRLEPDKLKLYERICKEWGTAVAEVHGTQCGACHMNLPGKVLREVQARDLTRCTNCGRVLHVHTD